MSSRRNDRFVRDIVRSRRSRQRRKAQRRQKRSRGEMSSIQEGAENFVDQVKSGTKEIGHLGLDLGKGVAREFISLGADFLITFATLGLVEPASMRSGRRRRRR